MTAHIKCNVASKHVEQWAIHVFIEAYSCTVNIRQSQLSALLPVALKIHYTGKGAGSECQGGIRLGVHVHSTCNVQQIHRAVISAAADFSVIIFYVHTVKNHMDCCATWYTVIVVST